ncbi:MAG: Gfo/Idh/MocA family oxidoreductase [Candidatus Omnitrophica bacterium]|nr:Gfo/Idh/MocA family oxidoreductase [Candidatus Omnitrophota bacterium]
MKQFRVGIIGCGTIFPMHAQSLKNIRSVKLVAVCDVKSARARKMAARYKCNYYTDYKKMLDKERLDAVHICTPHYLHKPMVLEAAKRKVNILVEKPLGLNPREAQQEIDAAKKNRIVLSVVSQNRCNPGSQLVKKRIEDGSLGKLKSAKLVLSYHKPDSYYKKSDWKGRLNKEGGGVVIDQAIHYLDILSWMADSPVDYAQASVHKRYHSFINVEDCAEGLIKFRNGFYVCFYLINYYSYDDDTEIEIDCEKGRVKIVKDSAYIDYYSGRKEKAEPRPHEYIDYGDGVRDYWGFCHYNQIKDFYDSLRRRKKPAITAEEGKKTQDLVWAIYESSRRNRKIYL